MKKKTTLLLTILCLINLPYSFAQFQYLSPRPGAVMINPEHNIIIREGNILEPSSLKEGLFSIEGTVSGPHAFKLVLADDGKTILLQPEKVFEFNEVVTVVIKEGLQTMQGQSLGNYSFNFRTHREYTLEEHQHFKELKDVIEEEEKKMWMNEIAEEEDDTRQIDGMFDIPTNTNPSPGDVFFDAFSGSFQTDSLAGYHAVTTDGDSIFSRQVSSPLNFLQNKMGLFGVFNGDVSGYDLLDSNFNIIDTYYPANGYEADEHEFQVLPDGHVWIIANEYQVMDLSVYNPSYNQNCNVKGSVIQEFDVSHNLVFEWRGFDHVEVPEALHANLTYGFIDYMHTNAIEIDNDGNILASHRHLDQVTKIDCNTGEFIWRMGGVKNEFTFINEPEPFTYQHDIRRIANGNVTLFDNGNYHWPSVTAAKEYALDEVNKTASLVWSYKHPGDGYFFFYPSMGSVQRLDSGNTFINWGGRSNASNPSMTEVTPSGTIVWELKLASSQNILAYRSHKYVWDPCPRATFKTLKSKDVTFNSAIIKWAGVVNAESYLLQYKKNSESVWLEKTVKGSKSSKNLTGLLPATKYDWRLQTWCDEDGIKKSGFTDQKKFTTLVQRTVLTGPTDFGQFQIYPNPVHEVINIPVNNAPVSEVRLLNMFGQVVITLSMDNETVSVVQLPVSKVKPGNYLVEIIYGLENSVQKVVIE
ncbi:MAG: aryl-sulfate sulfotransferase [Chitinophagales bacterium]